MPRKGSTRSWNLGNAFLRKRPGGAGERKEVPQQREMLMPRSWEKGTRCLEELKGGECSPREHRAELEGWRESHP